jgi:YegS/Rv2252/BmrU family lipid kinase
VKVERITSCVSRETLLAAARLAIAEKTPIVAVGGGDGTLSAVAGLLAGTSTALGVIPLGTGNAFARDLGIPPDLARSAEVIATGRTAMVDIGSANGDPFVNVATIGLTTRIAQALAEGPKHRFGRLVYFGAVLKAVHSVKPFHAELKTENGLESFETLLVVIGNGKFHAGPFRVGPGAGLTTGKFRLYALESASKGALLKLAFRLPSGTQGALAEVHSEETVGGTLTADPPRKVTLDGEIRQATPLEFKVHPGVLRVLVPEGF